MCTGNSWSVTRKVERSNDSLSNGICSVLDCDKCKARPENLPNLPHKCCHKILPDARNSWLSTILYTFVGKNTRPHVIQLSYYDRVAVFVHSKDKGVLVYSSSVRKLVGIKKEKNIEGLPQQNGPGSNLPNRSRSTKAFVIHFKLW